LAQQLFGGFGAEARAVLEGAVARLAGAPE
jgi:hypothetical protein